MRRVLERISIRARRGYDLSVVALGPSEKSSGEITAPAVLTFAIRFKEGDPVHIALDADEVLTLVQAASKVAALAETAGSDPEDLVELELRSGRGA